MRRMTNALPAESSDRRAFLGSIFRGGIVLPLAGSGAVALTDLDPSPTLAPMTSIPLPLSVEGIRLREIRDALHRVHVRSNDHAEWERLIVDHYKPTLAIVTARPKPTWLDCVELAEAIWHSLPKVEDADGNDTSEIDAGDSAQGAQRFSAGAFHARAAIVALVEAVLTLGEGQRRDPKTSYGLAAKI